MKSTVVVLFAIICAVISVSDAQSCKDENNNDVDWFYLYKLPKNKFSQNPLIKQGVGYLYITPQTIKNGWTLSTKSINDSSSIPGLTLSLLYRKDEDHLAVIYNDQPFVFKADEEGTTKAPTTKKPKLQRSKSVRRSVQRRASTPEERKRKKARNDGDGHTKGVVIGDGASGIWLVHSVPKFPPLPEKNSVNIVKYYYPETARRYGQSFLCMSLKAATLDQVGQQLCYNEPKILYSQVPNNWKANVPRIVDVIDHKTVSEAPWSNVANITTKKGMKFLSFAKSGNFKDDIYEGLVATSLKSDLFVESWINGAGVLESNCSYQYKVNNVEKVAFAEKGIAFSSHADHSKWAVSAPPSNRKKGTQNWICVGDINRAETQELRGGGTVCTQNYNLWTHYSTAINEIEPCKKPPKNG